MPKKSAPLEGNNPAPQRKGWSLKGSSLRFKMAMAVTIPMVVAAILGSLQVRGDLTEAVHHEQSAQQATILDPAIDYLRAVEQATVAAHQDSKTAKERLASNVKALNTAADELVTTANAAHLTPEQVRQVRVVLDLSEPLRRDTSSLSAATWVAQARQLQSNINQLIGTLVDAQQTPEPSFELLSQALAGRFSLSMQQALGATERQGDTGSLELFSELGVEGAAIDRLGRALGATEPAVATLRTDNAQRFRAVRTGRDPGTSQAAYKPYDTVISHLNSTIDEHLAAATDESYSAAIRNGLTTVAAFLAAMLLALLISHLLLDPIRLVREGTAEVAATQLPEAVARIRSGKDPGEFVPIPVNTTEEMGQLARAVDELHRQAISLASGEAEARAQVDDMFVTLSRRNTTLVNQQLALIESLEKDEEDPRRLESLFRLDHLASRMRRTADSLLILGNAPSRPGDLASLTVTEALHAATSGVLDYQRVHVEAAADQQLVPAAAADMVHLLTELVDNALAFSPPSTNVELIARHRSGGVDIEVVDGGLGISPAEMVNINEGLAAGAEVTSDTARRMGLFVVSRLAERHGVTVRLSRNGRGGTTAHVHVGTNLLSELVPAASGPQAPAAPVPVAPMPAPPTPERVASTNPLAGVASSEPGTLPTRSPAGALAGNTSWGSAPGDALDQSHAPIAPAPTTPLPPQMSPPAAPEAPAAGLGAGLPQRRPGATAQDGPLAQIVPVIQLAPTPKVERPAVSRPRRRVRYVETITPPMAAAPEARGSIDPASAVIGSARTRDTSQRAATEQPLSGEDTPMFRNMSSTWLDAKGDQPWAASEVEEGWSRAGEVAEATVDESATVSDAGLPMRRPGARLMPGSVTQTVTTPSIDPEIVRARLAAHSAGVSRGRHMAASSTPDPEVSADPEEGTE